MRHPAVSKTYMILFAVYQKRIGRAQKILCYLKTFWLVFIYL